MSVPRMKERALLAAPRRDVCFTTAVAGLTATLFVLVGSGGMLARIQHLDDAWLRLMISGRTPPLTVVAKFFNLLGLVYVTLPVRIAIAGFLALRRWWWHFAAFTAAVVASEVMIGLLKSLYDRPRPAGSLVTVSGASFPSGHAVAASVTVVAAAIALVPEGRRRVGWGSVAVGFSILMGLSRAYLGAHWLSDALAGVLLGFSCALVAVVSAGLLQRQWARARRREPPVGAGAPLDRAPLRGDADAPELEPGAAGQ